MTSALRTVRRPRLSRAPRQRRVLALVGDTQVGLWLLRSLARGGLDVYCVVRSRQGQAAHSRHCAGAWALEAGPRDPAFAAALEGLVRRLGVGSIMAIAEGYHDALIDLRPRLEPDVHVFSPTREQFDRATDKAHMQQLCRRLGVPVAKGTTLERLMAGGANDLRFPLVLRTRSQNDPSAGGMAPWKAAYARTPDELAALHASVRHLAGNILVQEYHPGVEEHVQVLLHEGRAFMAGDYVGEHHMPLAGGVTVQRVSCWHRPVVRDAVRLLQALDWEGIAGVQFHYDPDTGDYIFLEINPRFIGGLPTLVMAGFEAPFLLWQSHFEPDRMRRRRYRVGLRSRILGGDANWLLGTLRGDALPPGQGRLSRPGAIGRFLWNCGPWTRDDSFCADDPRPFLVDLRQMVRKLGGRSFDIIGRPDAREALP